MKKGVILSINKRFVTILTPEGEFLKTKRQERTYEVGEEITFLPVKPKVTLSFSSLSFKKKAVLSIASALLILFSILPSYSSEHVSAYMTIDVNPSIELELNDHLEVLKLTGLNEDGKLVIGQLTNWKGKEIKTVTNRIVEKTKQLGYLKGNKQIVVSTTLLEKDKKLDKNLKEEIKEISEQENDSQTKMKVIQATKSDRKQAKEQGISTGKYVEKKLNEDKEKVKMNKREPATDKNVEGDTETSDEKRESQSKKNKSNQEKEKVNNSIEKKGKTVKPEEPTEPTEPTKPRVLEQQYKQKKETSVKKEKNGQNKGKNTFQEKNKEKNTFQEKNKEKNTFQEKNKEKNTFQGKNKEKNTFQGKNKKPNEKSNRGHSNHSKDKQSKEQKWVKPNEKTEQRINERGHPSVKEKGKESEKNKDNRVTPETKKKNKTERDKREKNNKDNSQGRNLKKSPA
ncbi:anti-sigma-I factor RsgI family protein [Peribacillus sp. NPDC096540]|uniref:anti-sigma factor domain-containing protein n=1 Tax=Peribacillus sp. NPDC096540 TaxID=3390612 RepID=UPI003D046331